MSMQSRRSLGHFSIAVPVIAIGVNCFVYIVRFVGSNIIGNGDIIEYGGGRDLVYAVIGGFVSVGWIVFGCVLLGSSVVAAVGAVGELRRARVSAHLRTVAALAPKTLRWVCCLLPGDEGTAWWAEVTSLLAEVPDKSTRRRYVRSYRRNVPRLIWTSWAERLSASRQRELL